MTHSSKTNPLLFGSHYGLSRYSGVLKVKRGKPCESILVIEGWQTVPANRLPFDLGSAHLDQCLHEDPVEPLMV
jgi:hypothetical protein